VSALGERLVARSKGAPARRITAPWLAIAASLLLAAAATTFVLPGWRGGSMLASLARAAVGDHRNCAVRFNLAERPIPLADAAAAYDAVYSRFEDTPAVSVTARGGTITVLERHSCVYEGRRFAHVVMRYRGELVSLLVTSDEAGPLTRLPSHAPGETAAPPGSDDVLYMHAGQHVAFFVTDAGGDVLTEVAQALAADVSRQLAGA
jgi:hypothetical protein